MPEEISTPAESSPPVAGKSVDWVKVVLVVIVGLILLVASAYAGYWYGIQSAKVKTQSQPTSSTTPTPSQPSITSNEPPPPTSTPSANTPLENLQTEVIEYSPKASWPSYTDRIAGFVVQYPPNHKLAENVMEGQSVDFLKCDGKGPNTGKMVCLPAFSIDIYHDYDGGSRRVWLTSKVPFYRPYYQNFVINGAKALVAIEGNPGGSSWVSVAIPRGSTMVVVSETGLSWDPDTGRLPDLSYLKQILSTFKFLD